MSAFGGKADMTFCAANVCFYPKRTELDPARLIALLTMATQLVFSVFERYRAQSHFRPR
jgi:hypothetical protein